MFSIFIYRKNLFLLLLLALGFYILKIPSFEPVTYWLCSSFAELLFCVARLFWDNVQLNDNAVIVGHLGLGVTVANECSGLEFTLLAIAFVSVNGRGSFKNKITALLSTILVIQFLNFLRILLMFTVNVTATRHFAFAHEYAGLFLLILGICIWLIYCCRGYLLDNVFSRSWPVNARQFCFWSALCVLVLFAWQPMSQQIVLPLAMELNSFWLEYTFNRHDLHIQYSSASQGWHVSSTLFSAREAYLEGQVLPNLNVARTDNATGNIDPFILALPIYCCLSALIYFHKGTLTLDRISVTCREVLFIVFVIIALIGLHLLVGYLALLGLDVPNLRTLSSQSVIGIPYTPESYLIPIFNAFRDAVLYFTIVVLPLELFMKKKVADVDSKYNGD